MELNKIRNFSIIAHIDHGKSTLADRMLELTGTIEKRKMKEQVLDSMELEREKGITIKMTPVTMSYKLLADSYQLNLIDTPGHIDFSYEVSRALKAVEGSILLVDATQGVQAQTLTTLQMARDAGLIIIPVVTKIDSPLARINEVKEEIVELLNCQLEDILEVSGRTGEGVESLLQAVIKHVPPPRSEAVGVRALVFDFKYSSHQGVIVFVRVLDGKISSRDNLLFVVSGEKFTAAEVGIFSPEGVSRPSLTAGEIGYIVTGIKRPGIASVGDTVTFAQNPMSALSGYMNPRPVVWASLYPESQDNFDDLKAALGKLRLSDSSFTYEEESSGALGRGFRTGFLGMLHLEIITERLRREFNLNLIITTPSITYKVLFKNSLPAQAGKEETIYSPHNFPDDSLVAKVFEPMVKVKIITPSDYLSVLMQFFYEHEAEVGDVLNFGEGRSTVNLTMPLRELMRNFFDELKSVSSGYASISYEIGEFREADVVRLDILVADEPIPAFARVVSRRRVEEEAKKAVEKLHQIMPRQMFEMKVQGRALGRIISSETIKAFRKDVMMHKGKVVGGGDISRKKKLLEKQKRGKKKMRERGRVDIPQEVFMKMMKTGE